MAGFLKVNPGEERGESEGGIDMLRIVPPELMGRIRKIVAILPIT